MFYNKYCQVNTKDLSNHTNGVGAPLNWTGLHTYTQIQMPKLAKNLNSRNAIDIILHNIFQVVK